MNIQYDKQEDFNRSLTDFAVKLNNKLGSDTFLQEVFKRGFCEIPIEIINSFQDEEDFQWGGMWNGDNVDYMHFEIKKSVTAKYLNRIKQD